MASSVSRTVRERGSVIERQSVPLPTVAASGERATLIAPSIEVRQTGSREQPSLPELRRKTKGRTP